VLSADSGAAIGGGYGLTATVYSISLAGSVVLRGGSGIGSSSFAEVAELTLGPHLAFDCFANDRFCISTSSLSIASGGSLIGTTNTLTFVDPDTKSSISSANLQGFYTARSSIDNFGNAALLHVGELDDPEGRVSNISFISDGEVRQSVSFDSAKYFGFIVGLSPGNYSVELRSAIGSVQSLCVEEIDYFVVEAGERFYSKVSLCERAPFVPPNEGSVTAGANAGTIAGIVIGALVGLAAVILTIVFIFRKGYCDKNFDRGSYVLASGVDRLPTANTAVDDSR
jgi:hypothetical protein